MKATGNRPLFILFLSVAVWLATPAGVPAAPPWGEFEVLTEAETIEIPFELYRDDIRMIAEINGREVRMLIDNGSLWDQLLFFGSPRVDELGFDYTDSIQIGGVGGGGGVVSPVSYGVTVRFPGIELREQTAIVAPYVKGAPNPWEGAEGQVSAAFFKNFVVAIDFDRMVLELIKPDRFRYEGKGRAIPMIPAPFDSRNVACSLEMEDGTIVTPELMIDLGGVHPLSLIAGAGEGITLPKGAEESSIGYGIQGELRGYMGRIRAFRLGGYELRDVVASFTKPEAGNALGDVGLIGMPLLSRFNLVFDYPNNIMYIEPNGRFDMPFEFRSPG